MTGSVTIKRLLKIMTLSYTYWDFNLCVSLALILNKYISKKSIQVHVVEAEDWIIK